jgi:hypothetical protein
MFVYLYTEGSGDPFYTVGFYDPQGNWHPDSDHISQDEAARRIHYLNGGNSQEAWLVTT